MISHARVLSKLLRTHYGVPSSSRILQPYYWIRWSILTATLHIGRYWVRYNLLHSSEAGERYLEVYRQRPNSHSYERVFAYKKDPVRFKIKEIKE